MKNSKSNESRRLMAECCPEIIRTARGLIMDPSTPIASRVQLINLFVENTVRKDGETGAEPQSLEEAEARLMAMVKEIQKEL